MVTLGEICTLNYGKALPESARAGGEIPVYGSNGVVGRHSSAITSGRTIVIGRKGSFGEVNYSDSPCWPIDTAYFIDENSTKADIRWLSYRLAALGLNKLNKAAAVPGLNRDDAYRQQLLLPPLPEQRCIATILDQVDALRTKRREALAQLDSLTQSIFIEMFGDPVTNPKGWRFARLGDLIHSASDGPHVSPAYAENGVPFLSARHVRPGQIFWHDLKYLSRADAEVQWKKCKPSRGDILYTKGGTTGFAAVIRTDEEFAIWVHIALLKPNHLLVESKWLEVMLNTEYCYRQSQGLTHGIANRDLGLKRMVNIAMYYPPLDLQREFVQRMTQLEEQLGLQKKAGVELDSLFASLQHCAFRGEL